MIIQSMIQQHTYNVCVIPLQAGTLEMVKNDHESLIIGRSLQLNIRVQHIGSKTLPAERGKLPLKFTCPATLLNKSEVPLRDSARNITFRARAS